MRRKRLMAAVSYDPNYLEGVDCFNRREFFASHEAWEDLWRREREPARQFLKGMIQAAVALHHLDHNNLHGARKLLAGSQRYLEPYRPAYWGLDVDRFVRSLEECFLHALGDGARFRPEAARPSTPEIHLDPPPQQAVGS